MVNRNSNKDLHNKIIFSNIKTHELEAPFYDRLHGEIFNWYEQWRVKNDLDMIMRLTKGRKALDVGCGTGNLTLKLLSRGCEVTAVDLSRSMLDTLQNKITEHKPIKIICTDVDTFLSEQIDQYDILTISSVLHHLPDYLKTLDKLLGIIKEKGILYITHEPLSASRTLCLGRRLLYALDFNFWSWISNYSSFNLPTIDYSYTDYHVNKGFDITAVVKQIECYNFDILKQHLYVAKAKIGIFSLVDNLFFGSKTHFSILAQRLAWF